MISREQAESIRWALVGLRGRPPEITTEWNTGRMYAPEGQRITATLTLSNRDGLVQFWDHSRGLDGAFIVYGDFLEFVQTAQELQREVMAVYDVNTYLPV